MSLFKKIKLFFKSDQQNQEAGSFNADKIVSQVNARQQKGTLETGRRFHQFHYQGLDLFLDLDITRTYRITVYRGKERIYSFSVYCQPWEDEKLKKAYQRIITFLDGSRNPGELPDDERLKGFYYGG